MGSSLPLCDSTWWRRQQRPGDTMEAETTGAWVATAMAWEGRGRHGHDIYVEATVTTFTGAEAMVTTFP